MSVWSVLLNLFFIAALVLMVKVGKRMEKYGNIPSSGEFVSAIIVGLSGIISFSTCTNTMTTDLFRGWVDCIVGLAAISVSIWSLTLYQRLKNNY